MSTVIVWFLMILVPSDSAGRQVGPFSTKAQCEVAERAYNGYWAGYRNGPKQSVCVEGVAIR